MHRRRYESGTAPLCGRFSLRQGTASAAHHRSRRQPRRCALPASSPTDAIVQRLRTAKRAPKSWRRTARRDPALPECTHAHEVQCYPFMTCRHRRFVLKGNGRSPWDTSHAYYTVGYVLLTADVWAATVYTERNL